MDITRAIYKLPFHEHLLIPSAQIVLTECRGCHVEGSIYGGYYCYEYGCYSWFHKECVEAPLEINHPSHPEHPLLLTNESPLRDGPCDCCGQKLLSPGYTCPTCDFKVNLICGIKPSPLAIEHPMYHNHPLVFLKKQEDQEGQEVPCEVCKDSIGGPSYSCLECDVYFHVDCTHLSNEMNHPCQSLEVIATDAIDDDAVKSCHMCLVQPKKVFYHCSLCDFTMCLACAKHPLPRVIQNTNTHTHPLMLFLSIIVYTCKVCGVHGYDNRPYICFECDFMVHFACIGLPRVININRHDHRISFTHHLGRGRIKCGVCRKSVSRYYRAYSCSVCPNYAVHTRCAVKISVSDGVDQECVLEICTDIAPFKVVGDDLISHFSHEKHTLKLHKDNAIHDESTRCEACIHPVGFGQIYSCEKCRFVLHEKCANLPMKKKIVFEPKPYTLECGNIVVYCILCGLLSNGFGYKQHKYRVTYNLYIDVQCGALSEPFIHYGHLHPLYFEKVKERYCDACKIDVDGDFLCCKACDFILCFYCATLPEKIWHRSDEHFLTLYRGGKASGNNWCDVCERELDPSKWFYTYSSDCEVSLHARCVLADFSRLMPGRSLNLPWGLSYKIVLNNRNTRPLCSQCHSRCKVFVILKDKAEDNGYICSFSCLPEFFRSYFFQNRVSFL